MNTSQYDEDSDIDINLGGRMFRIMGDGSRIDEEDLPPYSPPPPDFPNFDGPEEPADDGSDSSRPNSPWQPVRRRGSEVLMRHVSPGFNHRLRPRSLSPPGTNSRRPGDTTPTSATFADSGRRSSHVNSVHRSERNFFGLGRILRRTRSFNTEQRRPTASTRRAASSSDIPVLGRAPSYVRNERSSQLRQQTRSGNLRARHESSQETRPRRDFWQGTPQITAVEQPPRDVAPSTHSVPYPGFYATNRVASPTPRHRATYPDLNSRPLPTAPFPPAEFSHTESTNSHDQRQSETFSTAETLSTPSTRSLVETENHISRQYYKMMRNLDREHRRELHNRDKDLEAMRIRLNEMDHVYRTELRAKDFIIDDLTSRLGTLETSQARAIERACNTVEDTWETRWKERNAHLMEQMRNIQEREQDILRQLSEEKERAKKVLFETAGPLAKKLGQAELLIEGLLENGAVPDRVVRELQENLAKIEVKKDINKAI